MDRNLKKGILLAAGLLALGWSLFPGTGVSQEQQVVLSQITVSGDEASLRLELSGGEEISATIAAGEVLLDGEVIGGYTAGDELEASWRALLGEAVAMDPDDLPALLREWTLPEELGNDVQAVAELLRDRLTGSLEVSAPVEQSAHVLRDPIPEARTTLEALVQRSDRLRELAALIEDVDADNLTIRLGETVQIQEGETVDGSLLIVDGGLQLDGTVEGDVILLGGSVELGPTSRITGVLRTADSEISGNRGRVAGGIADIEAVASAATRDVDAAIRDAVREAQADARRSARNSSSNSPRSPLRSLGRGIAGLFQTLVTFGIVFGAGLGVLYFFPRHLEVVSQTARGAPGRSFLVGLAGLVLACPLWVVGIVLLAISIIGIPLLLVWIPAVPVAVAVAIAFGYLGVARNLGGWFSSKELRGFDGFDATRPAVQVGSGLVILLAAYALANVFQMGGPLFGVFQRLLIFTAIVVTMIAVSVGLGAVILSRGGRDPEFAGRGWSQSGLDDVGADSGSADE